MSKREFEPIKMTGYSEERVKKNGGRTYRIPFSLSDKPGRGWEEIFYQLWKSRCKKKSEPRAKARVRKNELVLIAPLGDVEYHFAKLREDINATNEQYREYIQQKNEKRLKREQRLLAEKRAIKHALEDLTY